jgi:hypothetical protein
MVHLIKISLFQPAPKLLPYYPFPTLQTTMSPASSLFTFLGSLPPPSCLLGLHLPIQLAFEKFKK